MKEEREAVVHKDAAWKGAILRPLAPESPGVITRAKRDEQASERAIAQRQSQVSIVISGPGARGWR